MLSLLALSFPEIDPVAVEIGPLAIRWYALAYVAGIVAGWWYIGWLDRRAPTPLLSKKQRDDMVTWGVLGVVFGGRLGYVLFYNLPYFLHHPADIVKMWQGGMSFHGGALGVILAFYGFARFHKLSYIALMDRVCCATPIGLFFGRIANFINGELFGRVSDVSWAMIFPRGGPLPRHPSQLYEAALEGVVLFATLYVLARYSAALARDGVLSGTFLAGYGLARFVVEFFREPDAHLGFIWAGLSMGQLLSLPMIAIGLGLIIRGYRKGEIHR